MVKNIEMNRNIEDKLFTAILAKNDIAREVRDFNNGEPVSVSVILACIYQIEEYIGTGSQPSIDDIINDEKGRL